MWFLIYTKFPLNCYVICLYLFTKVGFYPFLGGIVWLTLLDWAQVSVATLKEVPDGFFLFQSCFYPKWQLLTNGLNKSWFTSPCIYTWIKLCISNTILFDIFVIIIGYFCKERWIWNWFWKRWANKVNRCFSEISVTEVSG